MDRPLAEVPRPLRQVGLLDELDHPAEPLLVADLELVVRALGAGGLAFIPSVRKNTIGSVSRTDVVVP